MAALDKVRPNLPIKPLPKNKQQAPVEDKAVRGTKPVATSKNAVKPKVRLQICVLIQNSVIYYV